MSDITQIIFRTILASSFLIITTKLFGKFASRNVTYLGFMVHIVMGAIAANLAFNIKIKVTYFLAAFTVYISIIFILDMLTLRSCRIRKWLLGESTMIIENGKILEKNLEKTGLCIDSLIQELRSKDVFDINQIDYAVIEPNGNLSLMKRKEYQTIQKKDLSINFSHSDNRFPVELIIDGKIIEENLKDNNLTKEWLMDELNKRKINPSDVNYGIISTSNRLYFDLFEDNVNSKP